MVFYVDDIEAAVAGLRARGVVFERYDGTVNGIMDIEGNYPSKGHGERAAWFRDSEGNMLGIAEVTRLPPHRETSPRRSVAPASACALPGCTGSSPASTSRSCRRRGSPCPRWRSSPC